MQLAGILLDRNTESWPPGKKLKSFSNHYEYLFIMGWKVFVRNFYCTNTLYRLCSMVGQSSQLKYIAIYVIEPMKNGHICTNYECSENGTFLGLCLCSVTFLWFLIDLWIRHNNFIIICFVRQKILQVKFKK